MFEQMGLTAQVIATTNKNSDACISRNGNPLDELLVNGCARCQPCCAGIYFFGEKIMVTDKIGIFDYLVNCPEFHGFVMSGLYDISEVSIRKAYSIYTETGEDALSEHAAIKHMLWDLPTAGLPGEKTVKDFFMNHEEGLVFKILNGETNWPELIDDSAKSRINALCNNAIRNSILPKKRMWI